MAASIHYFKFLLGLDNAYTQTTAIEQQTLAKYVKPYKTIVEIGVFEGVNTVLLANNIAADARVYGIDPFFKGKMGICWQKQIALSNIKKNKVEPKVILIEELSDTAYQKVPTPPDFIFIDGDHSLKGIQTDWKIYGDLVVPGGIVALHDTSSPPHLPRKQGMPSVKYFQDVIQHDKRFKLLESIDSLNIMQKI